MNTMKLDLIKDLEQADFKARMDEMGMNVFQGPGGYILLPQGETEEEYTARVLLSKKGPRFLDLEERQQNLTYEEHAELKELQEQKKRLLNSSRGRLQELLYLEYLVEDNNIFKMTDAERAELARLRGEE